MSLSSSDVIGSVAAVLVLTLTAGCGSSAPTTSDDPGSSSSRRAGPVAGATVLPVIAVTAAGGHRTTTAVPLDTPAQVTGFASQFRVPAMGARIRAALRQVQAADSHIVGQVLSVGCDVPPHASVITNKQGDVVLVPQKVASPLEECLVPVTTVAIAVLPQQ